jgi:hypothetical protein
MPGHPRSFVSDERKDVDARDKPGHDGESGHIGREFVIAAPRG